MVGVSVGILAAAIDIVTDWLGDLKEGFCRPTFYLNRGFCCWGISGMLFASGGVKLMVRARILFRLAHLGYGDADLVSCGWVRCLLPYIHPPRCNPHHRTSIWILAN